MGPQWVGRTLVAMKHVGVNVAANPPLPFRIPGLMEEWFWSPPMIPACSHLKNEQDNRGYGRFAKLLVLEPSDSQEALEFVKEAFELSERFDTPVMLRITTRLAHSQSLVEEGERVDIPLKPYKKNPAVRHAAWFCPVTACRSGKKDDGSG